MKNKMCILLLALVLVMLPAGAQNRYDFVNQEISEIVYAVSLSRNFPIVCDDTVQGTGSFRFAGGNFESAFDSFLLANRLYVSKEKDRWIISRIRITFDDSGMLALDASDVLPERIFEQLSLAGEQVILWESLPAVPVTIHTANVTASEACSQILTRFPGYTVENGEKTVSIHYSPDISGSYGSTSGYMPYMSSAVNLTQEEPGLFSLEVWDASFDQVLAAVHDTAGIQYISEVKNSCRIADGAFENRPLHWIFDYLCRQIGASWVLEDGLYLFSQEESRHWKNYTLAYISASQMAQNVQVRYPHLMLQLTGPVLSAYVTSPEETALDSLIAQWDVAEPSYLVNFSCITGEQFLNRLPSGYERLQFTPAGSEHSLFFSGTQAQYLHLLSLLPAIDVPEERITYDLLIIQTQKNQAAAYGLTSTAKNAQKPDPAGITAQITPGLSLNIDVAALFGMSFANKLQAAVTDNTAEIFADTQLHGISGVPLSFRNTNTYRYRDPYFSAETGNKVDTGVTREIVSGLVLEVTGTVSGDGSITTEVTASFTRQGVQDTSSRGNPPSTSEKMVTTTVRGKSGEIIILSGLVQDDASDSNTRTPIVSKIPLIGWLFGQKEKTSEKNEMIIYLIPRLTDAVTEAADNAHEGVEDAQ